MRFAPIGPTRLLRSIRDQFGDSMLGHYHLVLAHDVVENSKEWENLLPEHSTVIIDNGIIELGNPVVWEVMKAAVDILGQSIKPVVVLPDRFDDPDTTYQGSKEYYNRIESKLSDDIQYMYVIQGKVARQVDAAIAYGKMLSNDTRINWWGIPRIVGNNMGTRMYTILKAREQKLKVSPHLKLHLLGFSNNVRDDIFCSREQDIEGIDSAVPLRLGQKDRRLILDIDLPDQAGPRSEDTFWEDSHDVVKPMTMHNLSLVKRAIRDPYPSIGDYRPSLKQGSY